jgi:hypothetical protein
MVRCSVFCVQPATDEAFRSYEQRSMGADWLRDGGDCADDLQLVSFPLEYCAITLTNNPLDPTNSTRLWTC